MAKKHEDFKQALDQYCSAEGYSFDKLAKDIANGTLSRSQLLKLFGTTVLGGVLSSTLPGVASAKKKRKKKKKHKRPPVLPPSPPPPRQTPGFFVSGRNLLDKDGTQVLLRGVNKMSVFDDNDPLGLISFPEIKKTGANSVRIVWAITTDLQPGGTPTSLATLDSLITNAKANHLIPMIELHDATGEWSRLNELVNYWTNPAVVSVIQKHETYLLVNIGNEVGDDTITPSAFIAGYSNAIARMRAAGIHTPLVIDASDYGKNLDILNETAATLLAADSDSNLIFSVHLYWPISCGADAAYIQSHLQQAVNLDYPLIIGEFSRYGGFPCNDPTASECSAAGEIDYKTILQVSNDLQIGWYAWEWGPGNDFFDPLCTVMDMTPDRLFADLKPGWATEVAITSPYSIQQTSVTPPSI